MAFNLSSYLKGLQNPIAFQKPTIQSTSQSTTSFDKAALDKQIAGIVNPAQNTSAPYIDPALKAQIANQKAIADSVQAQIDAIDRQTAQAAAAAAAQPKLIYRDTNAAWQQAQNSAASTVNPVYTDYLNNFLAQQQNALLQSQSAIGASKTAADTTLGQTKADITTDKTRTAEDTATAIAQNLANEGNWQTTEGTTANNAEEQARLALGDQGVLGRGAGQLQEAKITRNSASSVQTKGFTDDRTTKELFKTRTFADLDTQEARAVKLNATEKANLDRQLSDFIINQGTDLTGFKSTNEQARLDRLAGTTQSEYNTGLGAWLAEQAAAGARPQDLTMSQQYYGR